MNKGIAIVLLAVYGSVMTSTVTDIAHANPRHKAHAVRIHRTASAPATTSSWTTRTNSYRSVAK